MSFYKYNGVELYDIHTPEEYGAVGDGIADDTSPVRQLIENNNHVVFKSGKKYNITSMIVVHKNTVIDMNGSEIIRTNTSGTNAVFVNNRWGDTMSSYDGNGNITIKNGIITGGDFSFCHGENITLENIIFRNSEGNHFLEICACKNYHIRNCSFIGMANTSGTLEYINIDPCDPSAFSTNDSNNAAFYDGTVNDGIIVDRCYFSIGEDAYAYGYNAIGVHYAPNGSKHKNITVRDCTIEGFSGCGLRLNNMQNVVVCGNIITLPASNANGIRIGDVAQSTNVIVKGNVITSAGTAITKANGSLVYQSTDNDINPVFT